MLARSPNRLAELTAGRLSLPLIGSPMFIDSGPELVTGGNNRQLPGLERASKGFARRLAGAHQR